MYDATRPVTASADREVNELSLQMKKLKHERNFEVYLHPTKNSITLELTPRKAWRAPPRTPLSPLAPPGAVNKMDMVALQVGGALSGGTTISLATAESAGKAKKTAAAAAHPYEPAELQPRSRCK